MWRAVFLFAERMIGLGSIPCDAHLRPAMVVGSR